MKALLRNLLIFLLLFNAVGAFYGGTSFLLDPSGGSLHISTDLLGNSPFNDYFWPGVILLLVNGLLPLVAGLGLLLKKNRTGLPVLKKYHWAWSLALASGLGLMTWIGVQIAMLGYWKEFPIQAVFATLGMLITTLALLPQVRQQYKIGLP